MTQAIENQIGPRLLGIKEAAQQLGVTVWALRELIWGGALQVVRFDRKRKLYVDSRDLITLIERNKVSLN